MIEQSKIGFHNNMFVSHLKSAFDRCTQQTHFCGKRETEYGILANFSAF